jgi:hypothetical protein
MERNIQAAVIVQIRGNETEEVSDVHSGFTKK